MEINQKNLSEMQTKVNELQEKISNGTNHHEYLLRK